MKTIEEFLKEKVNLSSNIDELKDYIVNGMVAVAQFHLYHINTQNGTHHSALGDFYAGLQDEVDGLAEAIIGNTGLVSLDDYDEDDFNGEYEADIFLGYHLDRTIKEATELRDRTSKLIAILNNADNKSFVDKLVDIQELVDKLLFKLQLS